MNSRSLLLCSLSTLVLSSFSQVCSAQPRLAAFASLSTNDYSMGDVNEELRALGIERISSGLGWSVGVRGHMASISLSMSYSRLSAETHHSDDAGIIEYQRPANVIESAVSFDITSNDISRFALGLGVAGYFTRGDISVTSKTGDVEFIDVSANGMGMRPFLLVETKLTSRISVFVCEGWSFARLTNVDIGRIEIDVYSIDYSGFQGSGGVSVLLKDTWNHSISTDYGSAKSAAVLAIIGAYVSSLILVHGT